jgi:hypothetical protein
MMLCGVVDMYQRLRETCFLHFQGRRVTHLPLKAKTAHSSETSANIYQTTRRHKPDVSCHLVTAMRSHISVPCVCMHDIIQIEIKMKSPQKRDT